MPNRHKSRPLADRLWSRVDCSGSGCWLWQGCTHEKGYGIIAITDERGKHTERTHRLAYILTYGPIPDGMLVCHHCDNPRCCRPDHLFLGSALQNSTDMRAKNRPRGRYRTTPTETSIAALGIRDIPDPAARTLALARRLAGQLKREKVKA